ncbi:MAG: PAS domain-containing protein, partial [Candidatus Hydrogenedens sp.]|nr:PAS domain-containing protein [Candidatus Hydrogenedens sp.]
IIQLTDSDLFDKETHKLFVDACNIALQGSAFQNPDFVLQINGERRHFIAYIAPLKATDGSIDVIFGSMLDVTEFRETQTNFKNLFYSMQEAFAEHEMIYDEEGNPVDYRFIIVNPAFENMTGLKIENVIGKRVKEVLPDLEPFWINTYAHVVKTGKPITFVNLTKSLNRYYLVYAYKTGPKHFACIFTDITEQKRFEEEIKRLNREWEKAYQNINSVIWFLDEEFKITRTNSIVKEILNLAPEEVLGKRCWEIIHHTKEPPSFCPVIKLMKTKRRERLLFQQNNKWYEVVADPVFNDDNQIIGVIHILSDITEQKQLEQEKEELQKQLIHSQKLEALGRLAGGIAHDFNNMLSVIMGNIELALFKEKEIQPIKNYLIEIRNAVERSANLTQKILAFARKQSTQPKVININKEIQQNLQLLKRIIPERILIEFQPADNLWDVFADSAHIDTIILNLCVNARDAIPNDGKITIKTENITIDSEFTKKYIEATTGDYVLIKISDTGTGIHPDILPHIFEPFFTTKKQGEGTGLGLATVYGTVKQNNGFITVESTVGKGTTFTIYLPRYKEETSENKNDTKDWIPELDVIPEEKRGAVLIIDDEKSVLDTLSYIISRMGFEPILTTDPIEAIKLAKENKGKIKLLISDVILPVMNGFDLSKRIEEFIPSLKTLFISGYAEELITHELQPLQEVHLLNKPFSIQILTQKIKELLEL